MPFVTSTFFGSGNLATDSGSKYYYDGWNRLIAIDNTDDTPRVK
jgi:hypothetical protein